jgi:soluble lytic murein transglycosylase
MQFTDELARISARHRRRFLTRVVVASTSIIAAATLLTPAKLAMSERIDPISRAEQLIGDRNYRWAAKILDEMDLEGLDPWEQRRVRMQQGLCAAGMGEHRDALALFAEGVEGFDPIEGYVRMWVARSYKALGIEDSATAHYSTVLSGDPGRTLYRRATFEAARHYEALDDHGAAAETYKQLLDRGGRSSRAVLGLADAISAEGDSLEAHKLRLKLIRDYPSSKDALRALRASEPLEGEKEIFYGAVCYARHGKYRTAARLLSGLTRSAEDRVWKGRAQYELGKVYYGKRDYRSARNAYRKAYRTHRVPKGLLEEARSMIRLGADFDGARKFEAFAKEFPSISGAAEGLWQAAMAYERRGHPKNAARVFKTLARQYPKSDFAEQARWRSGYLQFKRGNYEEAARDFLLLANHTEENYLRDQGYYWAGKCYQRLGREDEWDFWLERASEGFPASYYSARARAALGTIDEAYPYVTVDSTVAESEYTPTPALIRGDLLAALGLYREAASEYASTESEYQRNRFALNDLLHRYERINAMDRALRMSNYLLAIERDSGVPMSLASFRRLYPTYYWGSIYKSAQETNLDPNLIIAIMRQESAFNRQAMSSAGARGLMQLMPATGRDMARKVRVKGFKVDDLWKANTSIRLGSQHLSDHMKYFSKLDEPRQLGLALSAYNAGLEPARRWSRRLPKDDVDEFVESIPYRETRNYVKLVYRNYQVYSYLQDGEPGEIEPEVH